MDNLKEPLSIAESRFNLIFYFRTPETKALIEIRLLCLQYLQIFRFFNSTNHEIRMKNLEKDSAAYLICAKMW